MLVDLSELQNTEMFLLQQVGEIRRKLDKQNINFVNVEKQLDTVWSKVTEQTVVMTNR